MNDLYIHLLVIDIDGSTSLSMLQYCGVVSLLQELPPIWMVITGDDHAVVRHCDTNLLGNRSFFRTIFACGRLVVIICLSQQIVIRWRRFSLACIKYMCVEKGILSNSFEQHIDTRNMRTNKGLLNLLMSQCKTQRLSCFGLWK